MSRRLKAIAALLVILAIVFTACAAPAAPTPTPPPPTKAAAPTAAPALATAPATTPAAAATKPAAAPTVAAAAPTKPAAPAKVDNMTFAIASLSAAYWPINVGRIKNFYKDENINLELLLVTGAPGQLQALLANAAQVSGSQIQAIITAIETGTVKARLVGNIDASVNYVMMANKDIKTIPQLKGKRFGVSSPTGGEVALTKKVMQVKGLNPNDVDWISAGIPSTRVQGLRAGAIDGTIVANPDHLALEADGFTVLSHYVTDLPNFPFLSYTMTEDFLKANPDLAVRFLRGSYKATQWLMSPANKQEAINILVQEAKMEPAVVAQAYPFFIEEGGLSKTLELTEAGLKNVMDLMIEVGDLKAPAPAWTKYVDMSYLQKAKQ